MKWKPEKKFGIPTHDLCDTGAVLYRLSYQANWELVKLWVRNIPVDSECKWIYERPYILNCGERYEDTIHHRSCRHNLSRYQLIAQLVEHCTNIAEDMASNPVQAWNEIEEARSGFCGLTAMSQKLRRKERWKQTESNDSYRQKDLNDSQ